MDIILCVRVGSTISERGEVIPIYIIIIIIVKKASRGGAEVADTYIAGNRTRAAWSAYAHAVSGLMEEKKAPSPLFKIHRYIL